MLTTDCIVDQLRHYAASSWAARYEHDDWIAAAADEIEQLRTQIELHKQNNKDVFATCEVEIDRLRTALEEIAEGMYLPGTSPREIVSSMRATACAALGATDEQRGPSE